MKKTKKEVSNNDPVATSAKNKKLKKKVEEPLQENVSPSQQQQQQDETFFHEAVAEKTNGEEAVVKKRGRKPRGGKLLLRESLLETAKPSMQNVILHLKCSLKDLEEHNATFNKLVKDPLNYNPEIPPEIMTYDMLNTTQPFGLYDSSAPHSFFCEDATPTAAAATTSINNPCNNVNAALNMQETMNFAYSGICKKCNESMFHSITAKQTTEKVEKEDVTTDLNNKIKNLKISYYKGNVDLNKRSCCFWCSFDYENKPFYIPRHDWLDTILVYGNFCSPECAVSFLFKENIDDHTKFERYHLINKLYGGMYDYKEGIKPAPDPFYLLERYMGSLTIEEYRKLIKSSTAHSLIIIDKPMTRILPEIHTDNDTVGSTYKIKKAEKPTNKKM